MLQYIFLFHRQKIYKVTKIQTAKWGLGEYKLVPSLGEDCSTFVLVCPYKIASCRFWVT